MGSGGTEWESNDNFDPIRMNQKTRFVGTGQQASNLITPQIGQCVFPTVVDGTFTKTNKHYFRNSANNAWIDNILSTGTEWTDVGSSSGSISTAAGDGNNNKRLYRIITIPSTHKFYIPTYLEIGKTDPSAQSELWLGADLLDSTTPSSTWCPLVCWGTFANASVNGTFKRFCGSVPLKPGDILGLWVNSSGSAGSSSIQGAGSGTRYERAEGFPTDDGPPGVGRALDVAWSSGTATIPNIKIYCMGYS